LFNESTKGLEDATTSLRMSLTAVRRHRLLSDEFVDMRVAAPSAATLTTKDPASQRSNNLVNHITR
jgi:hypothetical protein